MASIRSNRRIARIFGRIAMLMSICQVRIRFGAPVDDALLANGRVGLVVRLSACSNMIC